MNVPGIEAINEILREWLRGWPEVRVTFGGIVLAVGVVYLFFRAEMKDLWRLLDAILQRKQ